MGEKATAGKTGLSKRVLITGGAGFIGSHLADRLIERGDSVIVLDDLSTGRAENLEAALASGGAELVEGSTTDRLLVETLMRRVDRCFHLASAVGVRLIVNQSYGSLLRNVRGADCVFHVAADCGVRTVFSSSSEIYGKHSRGALGEGADRLLGPPQLSRWSYGTAKAFAEALAFGLFEERGAEMIVARLFNTTGPRQLGNYGMVLPTFVRQALAGEDLTVYGNGTQTRCFAHVDDIVRGLIELCDREDAVGRPFNLGTDGEISVNELAGRIVARSGSVSSVRQVPFDEAYGNGFEDIGRRRPDTSALRELTGWAPKLTVDDAIDDTIAYERARMGRDAIDRRPSVVG